MKWFLNMKVSTKLLTGFILVALIAGIVGAVGIINISTIDERDKLMYSEYTDPSIKLGDIVEKYHRIRVNHRDLLISNDENIKEQSYSKINQYTESMLTDLSTIEKAIENEKVKAEVQNLKGLLTGRFAEYNKKIIDLEKADNDAAAEVIMYGEGAAINDEIQKLIDNLFELEQSLAEEDALINEHTTQTATETMIVSVIIAVLLAIALGIFISGIISNPVKALAKAADKLALGDINVDVNTNRKDEIGKLTESFVRMVANVHEQAAAVERIASGDLTVDAIVKSEKDILNIKLNEMAVMIRNLISEMVGLSEAAINGDLSKRGDTNRFNGDYRKIVVGVNDTLDAIISPINEAAEVLEELSKGNLQASVNGDYKGDHAVIKNAINNTINSFNEVLSNINSASAQVASGSKQMSDSSMALSQGATEQASSIEELTASLEEISSQTKLNADNASEANELAELAKSNAVMGNEEMQEMLKAMVEINESSSK
ncbi:MAG: MCP four helix bundle domain-containing protein [Caulobacteraceae bacterium]